MAPQSIRSLFATAAIALTLMSNAFAERKPALNLVCGEGFSNPLGFHTADLTFSWQLPEGVKSQRAFRLACEAGEKRWESGWIESAESIRVPYGGPKLSARDVVTWRVDYRDENGVAAGWSEPATVEIGLLSASDWQAKWVKAKEGRAPEGEPVTWFRRQFTAAKTVKSARLYVAARGWTEVALNGKRVGHDHFAEGWTSYAHRLDSLTYDVTSAIHAGSNDLTVMLGNGWYAGRLAWKKRSVSQPELLLQMEVQYADGSKEVLVSDESWQATCDGPIVSSSIYDGEVYDARKPIANWGAVVANADLGPARISPKPFPPVRQTQTLTTHNITEPEPGHFVFDLGQNMTGWARIRVPVEKDATIRLRFAEMLQQDGKLYTANYRSAKSTDFYTAAETGVIEWEPHFTFHGFRYVELSGLPAGVKPEAGWVTGVVLHSDLKSIGKFECSNPKLNQLQSNIVWGQRGNFVDIPTDCPQRDERLGWTGDAQVFCTTAAFNYDCLAFWKSWLGTMRHDQLPNGGVPDVIPNILGEGPSSGWMDVATILPWEMYVRTGDLELLSQNLPMMRRVLEFYRAHASEGLITKAKGYGDWLQPYAKDQRGDTPFELIASAFYAHDARITAQAAELVGAEDKLVLQREADLAAKAFAAHYLDATGKLQNAPETQTGYLLALGFGLVPSGIRAPAVENLVRLFHEADDHLRTGFLGTPFIVRVLDDAGCPELALKCLLQETYPSWIYSINQGATTMWERWDSYSHDKGFGNVGMNSFNHYAYGAIGAWLYERLAGLAPDPSHPGYKHFRVRPLVKAPIESAAAELQTPYGLARSSWKKTGGKVRMEVMVPPNTTATVEPPTGKAIEVGAGQHHFEFLAP